MDAHRQRCSLQVLLIVSLLLVACARPVEDGEFQETSRLYRGLSPIEAEFTARLNELMPRLLQAYAVPGAVIALVSDGEVAWASGYGWADGNNGRAMTPETVFPVNSVSMAVTAWGVMRLVEEGRLDLDRPIVDYLDEWPIPRSEHDERLVTARTLLTHTSGISVATRGPRAESIRASLAGLQPLGLPASLEAAPGSFLHSEHNYSLLQLAIEEITGQRFAEFMREQVLTPLEMTTAGYEVTYDLSRAAAVGFADGGAWRRRVWTESEQASSGLVATATDLGNFLAAHVASPDGTPPGRGVLSPESVNLMLTAVAGTEGAQQQAAPHDGYALGYRLDVLASSESLLSQLDHHPGWTSLIATVPESEIGLVVLENGDGPALRDHLLCEWLAWSGNADGRTCSKLNAIYQTTLDSPDAERISVPGASEEWLSWAPDGGRIAFTRGGERWGLYTARADGSDERWLGPGVQPAWSPDGSQLAFMLRGRIVIANAADGSSRELRGFPDGEFGAEVSPAWSPDGRQLAVMRAEGRGELRRSWGIWVIDVDTGNRTQLGVDVTVHEWELPSRIAWSPDGEQIAFASANDIAVVEVREGTVVRLTSDGLGNRDPAWSPDGTTIAFSAGQPGNREIYLMRADGSERRLLLEHPGDDILPAWSPDAGAIAFTSNASESLPPARRRD